MDHKQKLIATPTCRGQGVRAETMVDGFSNLPDGVTHQILSHLTITDVTRFGSVSKRCRQLHLSTPSLKFEGFSEANLSTLGNRLALLNALDGFMIRRGDVKLQTFRFRSFCGFEKSRIIEWIRNALRCNVEGLDFELGLVDLPLLFQSILRCATLRSLSVEMKYKYRFLTLPSSACFANIECLKLKNIHVVDEGFFRWISSSCKCIKELRLEGIEGISHLSIESSSLVSFSVVHPFQSDPLILSISAEKLVDLVIDWGFQNCKKVLNVTAPEVRYLKLEGNSLIHQKLGELRRLEKADLCLRPGGNDINMLSEFISSIRSVKVLILGEEILKALFQKGSRPAPLDNVRHLCIHVGYMLDDVVPAMVSILKGIPNLSTLYIKSFPIFIHLGSKSSGHNVAYWKLLDLAFVHQLEEVTIELPNGSNGIELASYLLEHAKSLKKMVIVHSPQQSSVERKLHITYKKSNLRAVLEEDQKRGTLERNSRRAFTRERI
ncbi:putative F-box domain, FBD domain, leucine-rich repeat domain, L domain-containing protein [Rosa chinensis]|uniref:Putative F-box domain, FBD domain, leucine-rich repeat domain, L domain-containing protein n=1 Tax=Rosa chinensis TaxID=74649 RepID=A0A2P6RCC4_ROSCH|nr:putative F-box/FBD/LRR-repeat protein At5g44950 [Rosa chinensis]PRQ44089.1 putative F-box domain, FBD domain, leucine-rich repeat domain, L domain-containing protein [Rosa chinensis]